ncbi:MAG: flagellar motor protein MotB [Acidobacteriaceae bacterium]|nr:flagellar motor protein MotB [Acidobacteriaceae bacterium]
MKKTTFTVGLSVFVLGTALGLQAQDSTSQQSSQTTPPTAQEAATPQVASGTGTTNPDDKSTYATGKPLQNDSREGFWGKANPFARKRWVHRQVDPIKDRANELDQLQAKNANDIRDVDARATAGINRAMNAANTADQHATEAGNKANAAQATATDASNRTDSLNHTVSNLDQYKEVSSVEVPFAAGRTALGPKGRSDLDDVAAQLSSKKGYIVEVQGFSRSGVQTSQAMADSVVRYLVIEHNVPVFRIYRTGLGRNAAGDRPVSNEVVVTLLQNSLATMDSAVANNAQRNGVSNPPDDSNH